MRPEPGFWWQRPGMVTGVRPIVSVVCGLACPAVSLSVCGPGRFRAVCARMWRWFPGRTRRSVLAAYCSGGVRAIGKLCEEGEVTVGIEFHRGADAAARVVIRIGPIHAARHTIAS